MDLTSKAFTEVAGVIMRNPAGDFLLQRRDNISTISSPNRIGMFGGHKEGQETDIECAIREVEEETGLRLMVSQLSLLVKTRVQYGNGVIRMGSFYFANNIDHTSLTISEGALEVIPFSKLGAMMDQMVPTTAYVISLLIEELGGGRSTQQPGYPA